MMNRERLTSGLEMMGVAFDQTAIERFEAFHAILDEYNQKMDLTAVRRHCHTMALQMG